jgi:predicted kinase
MQPYSTKLIVLRGNSASGKSTVARLVRDRSSHPKIAIVEQDYVRRCILKQKEAVDVDNIDLIRHIVEFALSRNYHVILEGILTLHRYGPTLAELAEACPHHHFYYFDVSLEETLRRHATKPIADEVDETQLRSWYRAQDRAEFAGDRIIPESSTIEETVQTILHETGLGG